MKHLRRFYRITLIILLLSFAIIIVFTKLGRDPANRSAKDWRIISRWMRCLCKTLGLRVHVSGQPSKTPSLLAANHISWHDIIVLQSLVATGFVGKAEIKSWPLIGWLAHQGNTLFIQRGKKDSFTQIHAAMGKRLAANQNIMLFPEGTTTTGESVKSFRSRLLEPAINLRIPVQPVAIRYRGETMQCKDIAFVGDEGFVQHLFRTVGEKYIDVDIHFCEPIPTRKEYNWRELGQKVQAVVAERIRENPAASTAL